jgi:predicted DNA-binding protein (MmcQ/YjbR family)
VAVYKVGEKEQSDESREQRAESKVAEGKMFALIAEGKSPINLSLKCDPQLALVLREKYETVMPGYHLNKKHWNTLVLSGQLPWEEVRSLIQHSYALVTQK